MASLSPAPLLPRPSCWCGLQPPGSRPPLCGIVASGGGQGRPLNGGGLNELVCALSCPAGWCLARRLGDRCQSVLGGLGCTPCSPHPNLWQRRGASVSSGAFRTADRWVWSGVQGSGRWGRVKFRALQVFLLDPVGVGGQGLWLTVGPLVRCLAFGRGWGGPGVAGWHKLNPCHPPPGPPGCTSHETAALGPAARVPSWTCR